MSQSGHGDPPEDQPHADAPGQTPRSPSAPIPNDDTLPALDGYHLVDRIASGAMGSVYEAYQEATGRRVAVKFMHSRAAASESARRRFEREVELAAQLEHPNIVSVFDSGLQRGQQYYVMEFVKRTPCSLASLISASRKDLSALTLIIVPSMTSPSSSR